jgi:hypothetical protein
MERVLKFLPLKALDLILLICNIILLASLVDSDDNVPLNVTRRIGGDIYATSTNFFTCHDDHNLTFLVGERRCVKNEELLNGKHA